MGEILIGTASWTDKTLLASGWYPPGADSAEERLRFYAERFPLVEVDSTYYFPPSEKNSELWAERTPKDFTFNVKAFSLLTQHPTKVKAIYEDLRPETDKKNVYIGDLDDETVDQVWERFLSALEPLARDDKLGALLFQFPQWFPFGKRNMQYILECAKRAAPVPICVEFRNRTWMDDERRDETIEFMEGHGLSYVCVDMPQGFTSSIPPLAIATSELAVVRFHGRNSEGWESGDIYKRFGYDYKKEELGEWVPKIKALAAEAKTTHVLMNNCYSDFAQRNARELAELLKEQGAPVTA